LGLCLKKSVGGCNPRWIETIDSWERGRPVRTEREARKTLAVFDIGNNAPDADETSAFPALTGLVHCGSTFSATL
jgi:hypothetical protein